MLLKVNDGRVVPGIEIHRPDGGIAKFVLATREDEAAAAANDRGSFGANLDQIIEAKTMIALDAADGKLDLKSGPLGLQTPSHTLFWSDNSAQRLLISLAGGQRELYVNGKKVQITAAFKAWVHGTMGLESRVTPGGGRVGAPITD